MHLDAFSKKCKRKSGELVGWTGIHDVPLVVVASLWSMHVESFAVWGTAAFKRSGPDCTVLDHTQRVAGHMLLGFSKRSPSAAVGMELGWPLWSSQLRTARLRLLRRLTASKSILTQGLLAADATAEDS